MTETEVGHEDEPLVTWADEISDLVESENGVTQHIKRSLTFGQQK